MLDLSLGILPTEMMARHQMEMPSQHLDLQIQSTGDEMCSRHISGSHLCKTGWSHGSVQGNREIIYGQLLRILKTSNSTMTRERKKSVLAKMKRN